MKVGAGIQDRKLEAETETVEECCLLVRSLWLLHFALLYNSRPSGLGLGAGSELYRLVLLASNIKQENVLQSCL